MGKAFGKTYMIDMYDCLDGTCDSLELHYRFLEELTNKIGMTPMGRPIVIHGPTKFLDGVRTEEYPDKAGVSAWQPLIESGIQIHSIEPYHFASMDVYTCGDFDSSVIRSVAQQYFGFKSFEEFLLPRGVRYGYFTGKAE